MTDRKRRKPRSSESRRCPRGVRGRLAFRLEHLEERNLLAVLFSADFTDDLGFGDPEGFTSSGPADEWHLSTGRGNELGHSPDTSFYFGSGEDAFGNGSYGFDADGTLTSPSIDLTSVDAATLRFNHFLDVEPDFDFATVSIVSSSGTTVIATSGTELPNLTTGFEPATLNLTPFVGDSIQIQFRLTSDDIFNAEGWYVDDVIVESPIDPPADAFDFSDPSGLPDAQGFTSSGPNNQWHLSTGRGNDVGHSSDDSFYFGSGEGPTGGGTYTDNADGTLLSPSIDLSSASDATLVFNHFLEVEDGFDFATVSVIDSSGTTVIASSGTELPVSTFGFQQVQLDLSPFVGETIQLAFRLQSDSVFEFEGWYVDDIGILQDQAALNDNWVSQGPIGANHRFLENIRYGNSIGGATHTVLAHPTDPDVLYAGTVNGGVWKTTNATDAIPTWTPQTDNNQSQSISAMAFDPTDLTYNTLVATTAGYSSFGGVSGDRGLFYRTTDGGQTWVDPGGVGIEGENLSGVAARGSTIVVSSRGGAGGIHRSTDGGATFAPINSADFNFDDNFSDLVEDPTNPNRLYAANTGEAGFGGPGGIYRSDDFGLTWTKITGPAIDSELNDLLIESNNIEMSVSPQTGRLYVAVLLSSQPEAIYHTNTASNTTPTWTRMDVPVLPQGDGQPISGASNGSPIVITSPGHGLTNPSRGVNFVVIDGVTGNTAANGFHRVNVINANAFELTGTTGNGIYTGGGTWTKVAGPSPTPKNEPEGGAQGRTHFSIVADPTNEDIVYIGGDRQDQPNRIGAVNISGSIFRGDASLPSNPNVVPSPQWDHLTNDIVDFDPEGGTASGSAPHADSREMVFDALGNLIEVDDGGVYKRTSPRDNTGDWISLVGNLAATEIHDIAYDTISNTLIGGLQDNGTLYQPTAGATYWDILSGGDGGDVVIDAVSLAGSNQSIRYTSFQNLGSFRKSIWDQGGNLVSETFPALNVISGAAFDPAFNTPVALNQIDPNRLLFAMDNGVYESLDQGETLSQVSSTINPTRSVGGNALAYGGSSLGVPNPDVAYVGDFNGNVHVRTTFGGPFISSNPSGGSTADIRDVVMDPDDWSIAFAIDNNQVFFTNNAGASWSDMTGNLGGVGASGFRSLEYIPSATDDLLVVGTNTGVYGIRESGTEWFQLGTEFPNVVVFDLDYDPVDDVLAAATMGRGAWLLDNVSRLISEEQGVADILINGSGVFEVRNVDSDFPDDITIQSDVANSQYIISGINQTFDVDASVAGATGDGTSLVTVPFASALGSTFVIETLGGNDRVTLDFDLGDFPKPVGFDGGQSTSGDELIIKGGALTNNSRFQFVNNNVTGFDTAFIDLDFDSIVASNVESISSEVEIGSLTIDYSDTAETLAITPHGLNQQQIHIGSSVSPNLAVMPALEFMRVDGGLAGSNLVNMIGSFDLGSGGLSVTGDDVTLDGASILTEANGSIGIEAKRNLLFDDNTLIETEFGDVALRANLTAIPASGDFSGIEFDNATVTTVDGEIYLEGRGGNEVGGAFNRGVNLFDLSKVESTGSGTITMIGQGGEGSNGNRGVQIGGGTRVTTVDGAILLEGTGGNSTGGFNQGIVFFGGLVESTGAGSITLDGTGGDGNGSNVGVAFFGESSVTAAGTSPILIDGLGGATVGSFNTGILVADESRIRSTGTGSTAADIILDGRGASAGSVNRGIQMSGAAPEISTVDGDVFLRGLGGGATSTFNQGLIFFSGAINSSGDGNLTLDGQGGAPGGVGAFLQGGFDLQAFDTGDILLIADGISQTDLFVGSGGTTIGSPGATGGIQLIADTMDLEQALAIQGSGGLFIQSISSTNSVGLAGASGILNLSSNELSKIADGFSSINIGNPSHSGQVNIGSTSFSDPVTIAGGSVDLLGFLDAFGNPVELIASSGAINDSAALTDIAGSTVTLTGTVAPGQSPGRLQVSGDLQLSDGGLVDIEIGSTNPSMFDVIAVTGDVVIGNGIMLNTSAFGGFAPSLSQEFRIIENGSANPVSGSFAGLPEGGVIPNFLGTSFGASITYQGGDGNDVVLSVVQDASDFGDAPDSYLTRLADGGPSHAVGGPRLGDTRDAELDGTPSLDALGDDAPGSDDEDGVVFGTLAVGMTMAGVNIDLQNQASALVDAWLDFDGDGVFQSDEQILTNETVMNVPGFETLNFPVNADAVAGETFARVRVSSAGNLGVGGSASDGEVEDHLLTILPRPTVESIEINNGNDSRSVVTELSVTFNGEVSAPASAFQVRDRALGTVLDQLIVESVVNGAGKTVSTLTFGAGGNLVDDRVNGEHSLVDGNYELIIDGSQIQLTGTGVVMGSDLLFGDDNADAFFRLFGDNDGDRDVDGLDLGAFGLAFLSTAADPDYNAELDRDGDGDIDGLDLGAFGQNFLKTI